MIDATMVPTGFVICHVCNGACMTRPLLVCSCCGGQGIIAEERRNLLKTISDDIKARYQQKHGISIDDL